MTQHPLGTRRPLPLAPATIVVSILSGLVSAAPASASTTVLYLDRTVTIDRVLADPTDLRIPAQQLPAVTGFVLKDEGACLDELCIPVERGAASDVVAEDGGQTWFSLTGFARRVGQGYAVDREAAVWSFSEVPPARAGFLERGLAPDFALAERAGRPVRLSDQRGKKVLLLTWASW